MRIILSIAVWSILLLGCLIPTDKDSNCSKFCEKIEAWSIGCDQPMLGHTLLGCRNNFRKVREDQCWHALLRMPDKINCNAIPGIPYQDYVTKQRKLNKKQFVLPEYED